MNRCKTPNESRTSRRGGLRLWVFLVGCSLGMSCAGGPLASAATPDGDAAIKAFVASHCVRCHDAAKQEGGFRIDTLPLDCGDAGVAEKWAEALGRINAGEMPPEEEPRPTAAELGGMLEAVAAKLDAGLAARMARRDPVNLYRLSREEYAYTIEDMLGVFVDNGQPGGLIEDPRFHGFERVGAVLALAPAHMERYVRAADAVIQAAFPDTLPASQTHFQSPNGNQKREAGDQRPAVRWLMRPSLRRGLFYATVAGRYRIRFVLSGLPSHKGRVPHLAIWHDATKRTVAGIDVVADEKSPTTVEIEAWLPTGQFNFLNQAAGVFAENTQGGTPMTVVELKLPARPDGLKLLGEDGKPILPLLLVDSVEVEGPIVTAEEKAQRASFLPAQGKEDDPAELRACLRRFAERAWRRPVADAELESYEKFYAAERAEGESALAAHRAVLTSMLVARSFLHLEEGSAGERRPQVNDFELAARLSYFLWSSLPDEDLTAAARSGALSSPEGLAAQVDRMLADPKIERFLESFPRQWLQLYRVGMFQPDPVLYPDYDPWLEQSMVLETTASFREVFRENLPLGQLLDADWTMLNPRLAIHYGLPVPKEPGLRRVSLKPEDHRGGILTQASTLSLTSDGTRHRPVHRGAWVSEAIFARTPPPPPPNVEPLEPVPSDQPKATIREQLAAHSTNATCASCHSKIDPLGLAFDNFDAIGRWRTHERVEGGTGDDPPVDASGTLPDGRSFAGPAEFKRLLAESPDAFARAFVEQLATYALRRVMTVDDAAALDAITAQSKADGYRLQSLVRALVTSDLFRKR
jgi:hypothetical protein